MFAAQKKLCSMLCYVIVEGDSCWRVPGYGFWTAPTHHAREDRTLPCGSDLAHLTLTPSDGVKRLHNFYALGPHWGETSVTVNEQLYRHR